MKGAVVSRRMSALYDKHQRPHTALLEVTWRCNLDCAHCYLPQGRRRMSAREAQELTTQEWRGVLDGLADLGVLTVTLTGGEAFMRPDFLDIVAHARQRGFDVRVYTTGTLMDERKADALVALNVSGVEISVYGREATHDAFVRRPGAFARSIAAGRRLKAGGVRVTIKSPLMGINVSDYPFLVELAEREGFRYKFDPTVVPRDDGDASPLALRAETEALRDAFKDPRLRLAAQGDTPEDIISASPLCDAGRTFVAVGPTGDVYPCIEWRVVMGNVRDGRLYDIWTGERGRAIRTETREEYEICNGCALLGWCPRCTGLAHREDGDHKGPSKEACALAALNYEIVTGRTAPESAANALHRGAARTAGGCGDGGGCKGCPSMSERPAAPAGARTIRLTEVA